MNKKISCEIQKYFLPPILARKFLAAVLPALPDIFQPWVWDYRGNQGGFVCNNEMELYFEAKAFYGWLRAGRDFICGTTFSRYVHYADKDGLLKDLWLTIAV